MKLIFIIIIIIVLLLIAEIIREQLYFKITEYNINSRHNVKGTVLFISDLHSRTYGRDNCKLIDSIRKASPDMILIGGDMITSSKPDKMKITLDFLSKLTQIAPCYYGFGNHEGRMAADPSKYKGDIFNYLNSIKKMGIKILDNESVRCNLNTKEIQITGLTLPSEHYNRINRKPVTPKDVSELIHNDDLLSENNTYDILLAHDPSPYRSYDELNVELILSGHYHGGAVRFGQYGMITPQLRLFSPRSYGLSENKKSNMIVTSGIGTHTIPIRLFNPGEIVLIKLS